MFSKLKKQTFYILESPKRFLILCLGVCFFTLVFDGSLWRLYSLYKQQSLLEQSRLQAIEETNKYRELIRKARNPSFLKKQARERFDWVEEDELVFLFSKDQ